MDQGIKSNALKENFHKIELKKVGNLCIRFKIDTIIVIINNYGLILIN